MSDTKKSVIDVITKHLGVEESEATDDKNLIEDLGADSLDTVEIVMALEDRFDIEIDDETAEKLLTVGDAVRFVGDILKARDAD